MMRSKRILLTLRSAAGPVGMLAFVSRHLWRKMNKGQATDRSDYKTVWDRLAETEDSAKQHVTGSADEDEHRATGEETKRVLEETVGIKPEDVVLEIGCGVGRVGTVVAPVCGKWIGCDVSANMIAHSRRRLRAHANIELVETSGYDLAQISDRSVDVVYCTVVFMHLDEWDRYSYVLEAHRVLHPGGRIFVDNFNLLSDEGWKVFESSRAIPAAARPPQIGKASTPQEIEVYLRRAGFREINLRENGTWIQGWAVK